MATNGILLGQNPKEQQQKQTISGSTIYINNNTITDTSIAPYKELLLVPFYRAGDGSTLTANAVYFTDEGLYFIPDTTTNSNTSDESFATLINPTNKIIDLSDFAFVLTVTSKCIPAISSLNPLKRINYTGDSGYSGSTLTFVLDCIPTFLILYYTNYSTVWVHIGNLDFYGDNGNGPYNGKPSTSQGTKVELTDNILTLTAPTRSGYPPIVNGGGNQGVILYC